MFSPARWSLPTVRHASVALLVVLGACSESNKITGARSPVVPEPLANIIDGAHGGNPHFYWLPPMVASPSYSGAFDPGISPEVDICAWDGARCSAPPLATYTMTTGPGSETVRVDPTNQLYIVNWHTNQFSLTIGAVYRITTSVAGAIVGAADVMVLSNGNAKNVTTGNDIPLVDGTTLPIKFRIELGMVVKVTVSPDPATISIGQSAALTATLTDAYGNVVAGQPLAWSSSAPAIAAVDATGNVTGESSGSATITAASNGMTGSAQVIVPSNPFANWTTETGLPVGVHGAAAANLNGVIYLFGGSTDAMGVNALPQMLRRESNGTWTPMTSAPVARTYSMAAAANGKIYIFGGWPCQQCYEPDVYEYTPNANGGSWVQKTSNSNNMMGGAAMTDPNTGLIYVFSNQALDIYDPSHDSWTPLSSPPNYHPFASAIVLDPVAKKIYVAGGESSAGLLDVYDIASNSWTQSGSMPVARQYGTAALINGIVYVFGGFDDYLGNVTDPAPRNILSYDIAHARWSTNSAGTIPFERNFSAGVVLSTGEMMLIGGRVNGSTAETAAVQRALP